MNTFGQAIPVNGPGNGSPGSPSRMGDRDIKSRNVSSTATAAGLPFGAGAVLLPNSTGGAWLSFADFLALNTNAALLPTQFAGIAVRNAKTNVNSYLSMVQSSGTATFQTTATGTAGTNSITVASATGLIVGQTAEGLGVAAGAAITAITGTTVTLSANLTQTIATATIIFTQVLANNTIGFFGANQQGDVGERGSCMVLLAGIATPQANLGVYIRTVANANLPGTAVGDFEAGPDAIATTTGSATLGSATLTVASATNVAIGQQVTGVGIPNLTFVTALSGTTVTLSTAVTATISSSAVVFNNCALLGSLADPWIRFATGNLDPNNVVEVTILNRHAA